MGGYLFQNLISFTEEIVTYIKGGWVSNTDVIILYIHNSLLNLIIFAKQSEDKKIKISYGILFCFLWVVEKWSDLLVQSFPVLLQLLFSRPSRTLDFLLVYIFFLFFKVFSSFEIEILLCFELWSTFIFSYCIESRNFIYFD